MLNVTTDLNHFVLLHPNKQELLFIVDRVVLLGKLSIAKFQNIFYATKFVDYVENILKVMWE